MHSQASSFSFVQLILPRSPLVIGFKSFHFSFSFMPLISYYTPLSSCILLQHLVLISSILSQDTFTVSLCSHHSFPLSLLPCSSLSLPRLIVLCRFLFSVRVSFLFSLLQFSFCFLLQSLASVFVSRPLVGLRGLPVCSPSYFQSMEF